MSAKVMCIFLLGASARRQRQILDEVQQLETDREEVHMQQPPKQESWPDCKEYAPIPAASPPGPAPTPPPSAGYYGVPKDAIMTYTVLGDHREIKDFNPDCMSSFCDKNVGQKMPDQCCDTDMWKNSKGEFPKSWFGTGPPDVRYHPDTKEEATCYPRIGAGPFTGGDNGAGGKNMQWIRNYLGCEAGKLYAHENCVPGGTQYVTYSQYLEGKDTTLCDEGKCPWSYPMSREEGIKHFENGTGESCYCSRQSYLKDGPGCYIAFATLAQYAGMYPAVFVRINGTCEG